MSDNIEFSDEQLFIYNAMKSKEGRKYFYAQLQKTYTFTSVYDAEPSKHSFNAGMQKCGFDLQRQIKYASIEYYSMMIKENYDG